MNRYIIDGLAADLEAGKRILFVAHDLREARRTFDQLSERALAYSSVTRSAGNLRITVANGGEVLFTSYDSTSGRGYAADVLVAADHAFHHEAVRDVFPAIASGGEFIPC